MVWRLKSYTGDKPCSTTSTSTSKFAQETGRYPNLASPAVALSPFCIVNIGELS
jgi:hypothetical protein